MLPGPARQGGQCVPVAVETDHVISLRSHIQGVSSFSGGHVHDCAFGNHVRGLVQERRRLEGRRRIDGVRVRVRQPYADRTRHVRQRRRGFPQPDGQPLDGKFQQQRLGNLIRQPFDQGVCIGGPDVNDPLDDVGVVHGFCEAVGMNGILDRTGEFEVCQQRLRALPFVGRDSAPRLEPDSFNDDGFGHRGIVEEGKIRVKPGCFDPLRVGERTPVPLDPLFGGLL